MQVLSKELFTYSAIDLTNPDPSIPKLQKGSLPLEFLKEVLTSC